MIKLFSGDDYSPILSIWENSVKETHDFLTEEDFHYFKDIIPSYFPQVSIYVWKENEMIKGFLGVSEDNIEMLFVEPDYFGQNIGKELLRYAIEKLEIKKVDVNEQNTNAFEFYKHFGFQVIGRSITDGTGKPYPILHLKLL